jgi:hypothetical protein
MGTRAEKKRLSERAQKTDRKFSTLISNKKERGAKPSPLRWMKDQCSLYHQDDDKTNGETCADYRPKVVLDPL